MARASSLGSLQKRLQSFYDRDQFKKKQEEADEFVEDLHREKEKWSLYKQFNLTKKQKEERERREVEENLRLQKKQELRKDKKRAKMIKKLKESKRKMHEEYEEKWKDYDAEELQAKEEAYKKKYNGRPKFKQMEIDYNNKQDNLQKKVNIKLRNQHRMVHLPEIKQHNRKVNKDLKNLKKKKDKRKEEEKQMTEELTYNLRPRPMMNVYQTQIKRLKEKIERQKQFSMKVIYYFHTSFLKRVLCTFLVPIWSI